MPLYLTIGRVEDGEKLCAVIRDVTAWKRSEEELITARQQAEKISTAKSEFLAKISHEIRTPLNAIIGFSEVMIDERFGALGNERYKQYLKDIHASGSHLVSLLNDLLDLSKIETGKLELTFVSVNLNELVQECVAVMQPEANRERVIIRTSLPPNLPPVVADARSVRQIALNVLSNSIKFTGAGGQVIVSTALTDTNEVVLRVRDTGSGMSEKELQNALEPFRQLATTSRWGASGTGLALPITKALAEANHARFAIIEPGRRRHAGGSGVPGDPGAGAVGACFPTAPITRPPESRSILPSIGGRDHARASGGVTCPGDLSRPRRLGGARGRAGRFAAGARGRRLPQRHRREIPPATPGLCRRHRRPARARRHPLRPATAHRRRVRRMVRPLQPDRSSSTGR